MKRLLTYCVYLMVVFTACEDIYTPEVETVDNALVVDARFVIGEESNYVKLNHSLSFNDEKYDYPEADGANVSVIDDQGNEYVLSEQIGGIYPANFPINPEREYKLKIQYRGDEYESSFEPVPPIPDLDTVYGFPEEKVIIETGSNNVNDFRKSAGVQLYGDITHEKKLPYYRFSGRKIMQYNYNVPVGEIEEVMYGWKSYPWQGVFNIAAPPDYSGATDIIKHPLWFLEERVLLDSGLTFAGWILILYQHGLSETSYNYYKDLNNQLESEGRLFDPLYVQARSNMVCTSDKNKLVLGNFEISTLTEHRYFVRYYGPKYGYYIKTIPYFYDIPWAGEQLAIRPDFWEYENRPYPDE